MISAIKLRSRDFLILAALTLTYWLTRLANLTTFPIFTDEAIYLHWAQVGSYDAAWRFIPLTDGKPPLFHWIVMITIRLFADPLIAGRIVSVFAGFANLVLVWLLAFALFNKKPVAHVSALLYLLSPFAFVYDRLAIVDGLLTTFSLVSLLLAVLLVKTLRLDTAIVLGASIGAGLLTKASGLLFLLLTPLTLLINTWPKHQRLAHALRWALLLLGSALISQLLYNILRLSQFFYRIDQKNLEFIIPFSQFLKEPFAFTWGNAKSLFTWQVGYLTLPIALLVILAFAKRHYLSQKLLLLGYYIAPFIAIASFNKIIFPRFLLFSTPFLLILAASGYHDLTQKVSSTAIRLIFLFLIVIIPAHTVVNLIVSPKNAAIIQADKDQYLEGQPSGHGVSEIVSILKQASQTGPVYLGTDGTFGLTPNAFEIYLRGQKNIEIHGFYPVSTVPQEVMAAASGSTTYFVYYNVQDIPDQANLELVAEFPKVSPSQTTYLRLYKVNPL